MKIYNKQDFLALPEGTFFCEIYSSHAPLGPLSRKGESFINDFYYQDICDIDWKDSTDRYVKYSMKQESYPINKCLDRDGHIHDDMKFMVYEREDLLYLMDLISTEYLRLTLKDMQKVT